MKLMACAVVAMSMLAGAAQAGDWRLIGVNEGSITLIDASSLRSDRYSASAWVAFFYGTSHTDPDVDYAMMRTEFGCSSGSLRMTYLYNYRADGSIVRSSEMTAPSNVPPPDSVGASIVRAACEGAYSEGSIAASLPEMFEEEAIVAARARARAKRGQN